MISNRVTSSPAAIQTGPAKKFQSGQIVTWFNANKGCHEHGIVVFPSGKPIVALFAEGWLDADTIVTPVEKGTSLTVIAG